MQSLERFSLGIGDRFGREGRAQLEALQSARDRGVRISPVWNKSNREHQIVGSTPAHTRRAADTAVREHGWKGGHFVDADHIGPSTVAPFLEVCDFFTIDVAEAIGQPPPRTDLEAWIARHRSLVGRRPHERSDDPIRNEDLAAFGARYLTAIREAAATYALIAERRGKGGFVAEVSLDEAPEPQSPREVYLFLASLAAEGVPVDTVAPRFTGRFNKGVDYVGELERFARAFEDDVAVISTARKEFGLPAGLKLSVHSGSDKFALYPIIRDVVTRTGAGVHVKTAGTTWLEELVGLAEGGGEGLEIARSIYREAYARRTELTRPYATVIDVDPDRLPLPSVVQGWDGAAYAAALRHDTTCAEYNPHFRQILHVSYRVAAEMGERFLLALETSRAAVARNVRDNLLNRHIEPLFLAGSSVR